MSGAKRIGVLGGTFDPIHEGHLDLARACRRELSLDEVRFLPSRTPPHKPAATASEYHRYAMVALAVAPVPCFVADPLELERGGVSFTIDTLDSLRVRSPDSELFFLTGMDSLRDLRTWKRWEDILSSATFVVCDRGGLDSEEIKANWSSEIQAGRVHCLSHEPPPYASRELRESLGSGSASRDALPEPVFEYLQQHALYVPTVGEADSRSVP